MVIFHGYVSHNLTSHHPIVPSSVPSKVWSPRSPRSRRCATARPVTTELHYIDYISVYILYIYILYIYYIYTIYILYIYYIYILYIYTIYILYIYIHPMDPSTTLESVWGMIWGVSCTFSDSVWIHRDICIRIYISSLMGCPKFCKVTPCIIQSSWMTML